jgi:hypothetical protein
MKTKQGLKQKADLHYSFSHVISIEKGAPPITQELFAPLTWFGPFFSFLLPSFPSYCLLVFYPGIDARWLAWKRGPACDSQEEKRRDIATVRYNY